jgi:hypothetical protein
LTATGLDYQSVYLSSELLGQEDSPGLAVRLLQDFPPIGVEVPDLGLPVARASVRSMATGAVGKAGLSVARLRGGRGLDPPFTFQGSCRGMWAAQYDAGSIIRPSSWTS